MSSLLHSLTRRIFANERFHRDARQLLIYNFNQLLSPQKENSDGLTPMQVKRLSESALIAASSSASEDRKAGLEIGTLLAENLMPQYPGISEVVRSICMRIGIAPTTYMLPNNTSLQPSSIAVENQVHLAQQTVRIGDESRTFSSLQLEAFLSLVHGNSVSISAPTSAGKSFLITQYVASQYLEKPRFTCVLVVPTRALIRQFIHDFTSVFNDYGLPLVGAGDSGIVLSTSSIEDEKLQDIPQRLFVLTQERLQSILYSWKIRPQFDLVIVDESQNIAGGQRGVLLEDSILEIAQNQTDCQFIFLSPLSSNPDYFLELLPDTQKSEPVITDISPVGQHVYSVDGDPRNPQGLVIRKLNSVVRDFEFRWQFSEPFESSSPTRLIRIAQLLGQRGGNILYASSPAKAEEIAKEMAETLPDPITSSEEVNDAIRVLSEAIHEDYLLIQCFRKRTGYHYGSMPDVARTLVEDLFKSGALKWVISTSTLLQGVNLPAKNVFIETPKLGPKAMEPGDFWNLAGRAGRLMKDLSGNVYCVSHEKWKKQVPQLPKSYQITSALTQTLADTNFTDYCSSLLPSKTKPQYQQTLNFLLLMFRNDGETATVSFLSNRTSSTQVSALMRHIPTVVDGIVELPIELSAKNKNIDFRLQNRLLSWLNSIPAPELTALAPRHPQSDEFYGSVTTLFRLTDEFLTTQKPGNSYRHYTPLAVNWVREYTFQRIIQAEMIFLEKKGEPEEINSLVQRLVEELNNKIRFHYVQNVKCFCDLLQHVLESRHISRAAYAQYTDFGISAYLELGLSTAPAIELSRVGMSRSAAIETARYCGVQADEIIGWLHDHARIVIRRVSYPTAVELKRIFTNAE